MRNVDQIFSPSALALEFRKTDSLLVAGIGFRKKYSRPAPPEGMVTDKVRNLILDGSWTVPHMVYVGQCVIVRNVFVHDLAKVGGLKGARRSSLRLGMKYEKPYLALSAERHSRK